MSASRRRQLVVVAPAAGFAMALALLIASMLAIAAVLGGASAGAQCSTPTQQVSGAPVALRPIFQAASQRYALGPQGPAILAGLTSVESDFGQNMGPSSAGAIGWTQFMPATWARWGVDANHDGTRSPYQAADAIFSSARYLRASGAPGDWYRALFAYNHSDAYVASVLDRARQLTADGTLAASPASVLRVPSAPVGTCSDTLAAVIGVGPVARRSGSARLVEIPGQPGMRVDARILPDVVYLIRSYHLTVTAAYATSGHAPDGEHPLGLAVDLVPGPGGSWDDVDRLAHWAEPVQNAPRPPFRWVGYDGDPGHGRGNHLHLSWDHAPDPTHRPPAAWVETFTTSQLTA
jgi:hypothetical protein